MRSRILLGAVALVGAAQVGTFTHARAPTAVPDLIWYTFDEPAGSTTTKNFAVPGAGFADAPVLGHQLGDGLLMGVGGLSGNNYVNTGWNGGELSHCLRSTAEARARTGHLPLRDV